MAPASSLPFYTPQSFKRPRKECFSSLPLSVSSGLSCISELFNPQWNSECPHPHCDHAGSHLPFSLPLSPLHPSSRAKRGHNDSRPLLCILRECLWPFLMHCAVLIDFLFCLSCLTVCSSRVGVPHPHLNPHHDASV